MKKREKRRARVTAGNARPAPRGDERRRALLWMVVIAAIGAAIRFAYIAEVGGHPLMTTATADPLLYDLRALDIQKGQWLAPDVYFHSSPLYPYFLALIYSIFGHSYLAVRVVQSFIGVGSSLLIFSIARFLFGLREAIVAGVLAALYVAFVFFDSELLMITLVLFASLIGLRVLLAQEASPRAGAVFGAGLALGVAALGKPNILVFLPAAMAWLWVAGRGTARVRRIAAPAMLALGTFLMIAPITISNYASAHDFVLTTSNGGINFYIGNNPSADGTFLVNSSMRTDLYGGSRRAAEAAVGHALKPSQVSAYWLRQGLSFARLHPGSELKLLGRKLLLFWNAYEIPNHYDLDFFKTFSRVLRFDPVVFAWMVPLGMLGVYVSRRRWRRLLLPYLFVGTYLVSLLPFFITARYRLPALPLMIVFSGAGVVWLWELVRRRIRSGIAGALIVLAAASVVVNLRIVDFTLGPSYAILGAVYRDAGMYEQAAQAFRKATEESPGFDLAYQNLGSVLGRLGRYDEAEQALKKAISLNPGLAIAYSNLGVVYVDTGRLDQARLAFMQATRLDDRLKAAWEGLARAAILAGDSDLGESALERTLLLDPNDAYAHWNLALLYARKPDSASRASSIAHARRAEALMPALRPDVEALLSQLSSGGTQQETEGQP